MRIGITGASGFVGRRVAELAREKGHAVVRFGRTNADRMWEPMAGPPDLRDLDAVVHLAGDPVAEGRWTRSKMARIRDSRVVGTRHLAASFKPGGPKVLVSASAIGYYGDRADEELTEDSAPGSDFLAEVCKGWEDEAKKASARVSLIRIGIVLGPGGGALAKMLTPFKLGLGGRLASGRQWMSWVHREDLAALILHAVETDAVSGPLLATAPNPVTNLEFTKTLGRVLGRPTILPMPRWQVRLIFGKVAQVLCGGQRCKAARPAASGFSFKHPDLEPALRAILS